MHANIKLGCAGWSVPKGSSDAFAASGSHLERYAAAFNCVEINSSFYRPHRPTTYARWAGSVPAHFRFSVKLPRSITHEHRLVGVADLLDRFFAEAGALGEKLGCVLIQLPPSFRFETAPVRRFFKMLRARHTGAVVLEPRHATWFGATADAVLLDYGIGSVAADPAILAEAAMPAGNLALRYWRLHGSPKIYYSTYSSEYLAELARTLRGTTNSENEIWCIFDNTAAGAATTNALQLMQLLKSG